MSNFINKEEKKNSLEFEKKGFLVKDINEKESLLKIRKIFIQEIKKNSLLKKKFKSDSNLLNSIHKHIPLINLNKFRLKIINEVNKNAKLRELYYQVSKKYLDAILGNELCMQKKINLSIQLPEDNSSLLPIHSDVWSGDSPFETVVWLPLVDCYKTKSMFILPPSKLPSLKNIFLKKKIFLVIKFF